MTINPDDLDYFPPGEPVDLRDWPNGHDAKTPAFRRIINPAEWEGLPVPPRKWIVPDYIPDETVTLLSGDGGAGKSLLSMQLAVARAIAREWIGLLPEPGRTLILSAEDDADEMHRRLDDIRKFYGAQMDELGDIRLVDLVGEDSISSACLKSFHNCAILLLSHPSLTGLNSGSGTSGSTGWNNGVRSRLYFQNAKASDGTEPDVNLRTLQGMKSNYGVRGGKVDVKWKNGLFVPIQGATGIDKMAADQKADEVFLTLLKRFNAQGRNAADRKGTSYAPALFAEEPDNQGFGKKQFEDAMRRLFKDNKIHIIDVGRKSKPSRTLMPVEK